MANKGGRPRFELSDRDFEQLVNMIRIQCTRDECCDVFGVTDKTLNAAIERRGVRGGFSALYKRHCHEGKASLRRMQWKAAEKGNPTMLIWLGKQMLGQRDKIDSDYTSSDGSMSPRALRGKALREELERRGIPKNILDE